MNKIELNGFFEKIAGFRPEVVEKAIAGRVNMIKDLREIMAGSGMERKTNLQLDNIINKTTESIKKSKTYYTNAEKAHAPAGYTRDLTEYKPLNAKSKLGVDLHRAQAFQSDLHLQAAAQKGKLDIGILGRSNPSPEAFNPELKKMVEDTDFLVKSRRDDLNKVINIYNKLKQTNQISKVNTPGLKNFNI